MPCDSCLRILFGERPAGCPRTGRFFFCRSERNPHCELSCALGLCRSVNVFLEKSSHLGFYPVFVYLVASNLWSTPFFPRVHVMKRPQRNHHMRFDRLVHILLPKDDRFFSFFEESSANLVKAAELLLKLAVAAPAERELMVKQMKDLEHNGDSITHKIFAELNKTFVTPFDREDIHVLAAALDDVMDYTDGSAARFSLYRIGECPRDMVSLIETLQRSIVELHRGVKLMRDMKNADELQKVLEKVNEYENEADAIFDQAIAALFREEKDAINVIKLKEIYVGLETATDKCEDAANVMEAIIIKHA
jgi:predicted phosphate transport protein (TIGR00153 family)